MTPAEQIAQQLRKCMANRLGGTLCIWGQWFGRPMDNVHILVAADAEDDQLHLGFDGGEDLLVWGPRHAAVDGNSFTIRDAERVRWEWFYYGRPRMAANRYYQDYSCDGSAIVVKTNVDWRSADPHPNASQPAVTFS
jgi:hypothetical protein